jgi:hypothetical protein
MSSISKLRAKVGDAEFEAEGPTEEVKAQFEEWKKLIEGRLPKAATIPAGAQKNPQLGGGVPDADLVRQVFTERDGVLTLQGLCDADADSLLMLVYGYKLLKPEEYPVTGVRLNQAATQSGIQAGRPDRAITQRSEFLVTSGLRRGKRYGLNVRGEQHAQNLMRQLFE